MRLSQIIRISTTNLKSNRMRTILTVVGISIGISSIVFLVSLGYGLQDLSIKKIASIDAISTLDVMSGRNTTQKIDDNLVNQLKQLPQVTEISPLLAYGIKIDSDGKQTDAVGNFVDDSYYSLEGLKPVVGAFFSNSSADMVVSTALLKAVSLDANSAINKQIKANVVMVNPETKEKKTIEHTYKIIGALQDDSTAFAYLPVASVKSDITWSPIYNSLKVKAKDKTDIPQLKEKISSMGYSVTSIADTINQVDQIFRIIQIILAFFGLIALMVASIGMFNTMTIALLERTRDIGIMKAVGVKDRDVSLIFLSESAIIATSGGVLGVVGGWVTAKGINLAVNSLARSVGGEPQKLFSMPFVFAAAIIIFSIFVGIATGFYPSKRASRLNPLDALRYE